MNMKKNNKNSGSSKVFFTDIKKLVKNLNLPVIIFSTSHQIIYVNPVFTKTFGYKLSDISNLSIFLTKSISNSKLRKKIEKEWKEKINVIRGAKNKIGNLNFQDKNGYEIEFTLKLLFSAPEFYIVAFEKTIGKIKDKNKPILSLEKYREFFNSAGDALFLLKDNKFIECNPKTLELFKCKKHQIINHSPDEFSPQFQPDGKSSKEKARSLIKTAYKKKHIIFEWVHQTADGKPFYAEVNLTPIKFDSGELLQAIVRDISDRKNVELQLKRRIELENLLTSISAGFVSVKRENFEKEVLSTFEKIGNSLNFDACFLFEFTDDYKSFSCKTHWNRFGIEGLENRLQNISIKDRQWWWNKIKRLEPVVLLSLNQIPESEKAWRNELEDLNVKSLINIPIVRENRLSGFMGFVTSAKELQIEENILPALKIFGEIIANSLQRHKIEEELRESEERFRSLYENAKVGIYRSTLDGKFLLANPALIKMFGCNSFEEISKYNIPKDFYVNSKDRNKLIRLAKEKGEIDGFETLIRTCKGEIINVRVYGRIVEDKSTKAKYLEGVVEDITEKKQAERALIEAKERAERSDKLKSEFLAQMSHEIRTPINTILSFSSLLKSELYNLVSDDLRQSFSLMERAGKRITRTIDLILNMSEIQTGTYEPSKNNFDLYLRVIEPLYYEYRAMAKAKGVKMDLKKANGTYSLYADEYTVSQIFNNLLDNAVKYTEKGTITIKLRKGKNNKLITEISDTGIGISKEYLPNLFTPFSQEEQGYTRKFEGNGLGLALVKKYCEINNAEIKVKSTKGKGTKFIISFGN